MPKEEQEEEQSHGSGCSIDCLTISPLNCAGYRLENDEKKKNR